MDTALETKVAEVKPKSFTLAMKDFFFSENNPKTNQKWTAVELKGELDQLTDNDKRWFCQELANHYKTPIEWSHGIPVEKELFSPN